MGILPDPKNQLNSLPDSSSNSLGVGVPSVASSTNLPQAPTAQGKDPCSSSEYLKEKLGSMPILGDMSLSDLIPNINLNDVSAPQLPSGQDIQSSVSGAFNDMTDSVGNALNDLKPSSLIPQLKEQAGIAGREALAGALETAMIDALGPVKGGIGDRVTRSVKQNLMMAGISEVANIIAGEPNIFDPCAGKDKIKSNSSAITSAGETGKLNNDINKSIETESQKFSGQSNRNARDIIPPVEKPALPSIGNAPSLPAGDNSNYKSATTSHNEANAKVTDNAIKDVAKKTAEKQAQNEHRKDQESAAESAGTTASGDHFKQLKKPGDKYHYINSTVIGPQSGWPSTGDDNQDIIDTINNDLNSLFIQSLDTRSDVEPIVTGSITIPDLVKISQKVHNPKDIEQQFVDYQKNIQGDTRHYMIWANAITTVNNQHIGGGPQVTSLVKVVVYRTCDKCSESGYTTHEISISKTERGATPLEAYKNATRGAINDDEFQARLSNELAASIR